MRKVAWSVSQEWSPLTCYVELITKEDGPFVNDCIHMYDPLRPESHSMFYHLTLIPMESF